MMIMNKFSSASLLFVIFFVFLRSWLLDKIPSIDLLVETILPFLLINKSLIKNDTAIPCVC
jgi:hypothetical protein